MYTKIRPIRSDYYKTEIFTQIPDLSNINDNFISLMKNNFAKIQN
jgi:hypothetical protein